MFQDYVLNGQGFGPVGEAMAAYGYDAGYHRPFFDANGQRCVTIRTGRMTTNSAGKQTPEYETVRVQDVFMDKGIYNPVWNATSLRKGEWITYQDKVIRAARLRLKAWADLQSASSYGGFDGMSTMILEHETMDDPGSALVDMEGLAESQSDQHRFQLEGLPLQITHSGFRLSQRVLAVSRKRGTPANSRLAEACGRRVAEKVEQTLIGTVTGLTYGGNSTQVGGYGRNSSVYGYLNFPSRLTKTNMTTPTGSNPETTVAEVLAARDQLYDAKYYGPFTIYHSTDWDKYLDNDYARLGGSNANMTLRDRLRKIDGITDVKRLDYLQASSNPFTMIFVQMTSDVVEAVNGMDLQTVQWEGRGGAEIYFRVMCIWVPRIYADFNGNTGLLVATTS